MLDFLLERYELSYERLHEIKEEAVAPLPFRVFFEKESQALIKRLAPIEAWYRQREFTLNKEYNQSLFEEVFLNNYEESYLNPAYAVKEVGEEYGAFFALLAMDMRGVISYVHEAMAVRNNQPNTFERMMECIVSLIELFLQVYGLFVEEELTLDIVRTCLHDFWTDNIDLFYGWRIKEKREVDLTGVQAILQNADLSTDDYLYQYGEYISDNELKMAKFLRSIKEEEIEKIAAVYVDGFIRGYAQASLDITEKKTIAIIYPIGMEIIVRKSVKLLKEKGLEAIVYRKIPMSFLGFKKKDGVYSTDCNAQCTYDHLNDYAFYFDKKLKERQAEVYEKTVGQINLAMAEHAGPILIESFGEKLFSPVNKIENFKFNAKQEKWKIQYQQQMVTILAKYIDITKRSFCIIAFPSPKIGEDFEEIFYETLKINTLEVGLYQNVQQCLIDALDQGTFVTIRGKGTNQTNLTVALHKLENPKMQTNFENCLADVNIPLGEVFTSPVLKNTNGVLHVSKVYLGRYVYQELYIEIKDGMIQTYTCSNFDSKEENKAFIKKHILKGQKTLPMGEFAIGTNTNAYQMAKKYHIFEYLPILIAEKMGPHFAFGDTCYSHSEDIKTFNPDGKEIVATDNECSILRKEDSSKAYFNCHTDITIPYDELDTIIVYREDNSTIEIIRDGRFVLEGAEVLNALLDD